MTISDIGTVVAILLGLFNLYWSILRNRKRLTFVVTNNLMLSTFAPEFVVLNGGKDDWLFTKIECSFGKRKSGSYDKGSSSAVYPHTINWKGEDNLLLKAGDAKHFSVELNYNIDGPVAECGEIEHVSGHDMYIRYVFIDLAFMDMKGKLRERSICVAKLGFSMDGNAKLKYPYAKTVNLLS